MRLRLVDEGQRELLCLEALSEAEVPRRGEQITLVDAQTGVPWTWHVFQVQRTYTLGVGSLRDCDIVALVRPIEPAALPGSPLEG